MGRNDRPVEINGNVIIIGDKTHCKNMVDSLQTRDSEMWVNGAVICIEVNEHAPVADKVVLLKEASKAITDMKRRNY